DTHKPGIKLTLALELFQVPIRLQERILHHIFRIFAVLSYVLRNTENVPVVAFDQLFKGAVVAAFSRLNQCQFITDRLTYSWLDGGHSSSDATIFTVAIVGRETVIVQVTPRPCSSVLTYAEPNSFRSAAKFPSRTRTIVTPAGACRVL